MKKLYMAFLLSLILSILFCINALALSSDSTQVQDMYDYARTEMDFDKLDTSDDGTMYRKFNGDDGDIELIENYVRTLCSGNYNLKLVDSHLEDFGRDKFYSWALDYTGSGRVTGRHEMIFVDGVTGNMTLYAVIEGSRLKGYVHYGKGFEVVDLGLRCDGSIEDTSLPGESLMNGLTESNGRYVSSDGRFSVGMNEAQIYRDGECYTADASFVRNQAKNREELHIDNFYRNESIVLTVPYASVMTGDVFDNRGIGVNEKSGYEDYIDNMDDFLSWTFSNRLLGVCHDGDYLICYMDDQNDFDKVVVRFIEFDPKNDTAVIYINMQFDTAPYEYEVLTAVSLGGTPKGANADEVLNVSAGDTFEIAFGNQQYGSMYHVYTWEILEGSNLIEMTGTRSSTCTIKAYDPGTVRVRVVHEYTVEGKHVLFGTPETQQTSTSREYVIHIAP